MLRVLCNGSQLCHLQVAWPTQTQHLTTASSQGSAHAQTINKQCNIWLRSIHQYVLHCAVDVHTVAPIHEAELEAATSCLAAILAAAMPASYFVYAAAGGLWRRPLRLLRMQVLNSGVLFPLPLSQTAAGAIPLATRCIRWTVMLRTLPHAVPRISCATVGATMRVPMRAVTRSDCAYSTT